MVLRIPIIREQMISTERKMTQSLSLAHWRVPCSFPSLFSFSEHVFEHINPEVLRGPDRHVLSNIRAYFGKWWNPSCLRTRWLLIYIYSICTGKKSRTIYTSSVRWLPCLCVYICVGWGTYRCLSLLRLHISKIWEKYF